MAKHHRKKLHAEAIKQQPQQPQVVVVSKNVCCTAPDGNRHLLAQCAVFVAFAASLTVWISQWAFGVQFGCWQSDNNTDDASSFLPPEWPDDASSFLPPEWPYEYASSFLPPESPYEYEHNLGRTCIQLWLNSEDYWNVPDDKKGWAGGIRAGALFGITATALGLVLTYIMFASCCFVLSVRLLGGLCLLALLSSLFQLFTLFAGTSNPCKGLETTFSSCSNGRFRMENGGCFSIAASILFGVAFVLLYDNRRVEMARLEKAKKEHEQEHEHEHDGHNDTTQNDVDLEEASD